jgi:hypothetical protein
MKMNASRLPGTGSTKVLCDPKVILFSSSVPRQGLPSSSHGPQMEGAEADRAALGAHPVHPDPMK